MIVLVGEDHKETMSTRLFDTLSAMNTDVIWISQSSFPLDNTFTILPQEKKITGHLYIDSENLTIPLENIDAIYTRLDEIKLDNYFEKTEKEIIQSERSISIDILYNYIETIVVNRSQAQRSNGSKLYQSWIVNQFGFKIPHSLITNDANKAKDFFEQHKHNGIIYKSCSAQRSIVHKVSPSDLVRLNTLQYSPVLFQEYVTGKDLRVHALATGEVFATEILSESSDYRYDKERSLRACSIPEKIQQACVALTKALGLYIAGIDLRVTPGGDYYCFEANPSPVFTWYEDQSGQPITEAVAKMLIKGKEIYKARLVERIY